MAPKYGHERNLNVLVNEGAAEVRDRVVDLLHLQKLTRVGGVEAAHSVGRERRGGPPPVRRPQDLELRVEARALAEVVEEKRRLLRALPPLTALRHQPVLVHLIGMQFNEAKEGH